MGEPIEIFETQVTSATEALALINGVFQWAFGPTEPSIVFPFLNWADTANNLWKQRNEDNNGWVIKGKLTNPFLGLVPVDDDNSPIVANGNYIINPRSEIAQRGTSFNSVGYTLDRWPLHSLGSGGAATVSQQSFTLGQTAVPDNPKKYLRWQQTGAASTAPELQQRIEYVDTLAGQTCTVIFWAKANAEQTMSVGFRQHFGIGGSPSADVDGTSQQVQLTANWQKFSFVFTLPTVAGKTRGSDGNDYLALRLILPIGLTYTVDIADVIVAKGINVSTVRWRPIQQEIALALRFCQKSYNIDVAPGTVTTIGRRIGWSLNTTDMYDNGIEFPVIMRTTPTVTIYNPETGNAGSMRSPTDSQNKTASVSDVSQRAFRVTGTDLTPNRYHYYHWIAQAEL